MAPRTSASISGGYSPSSWITVPWSRTLAKTSSSVSPLTVQSQSMPRSEQAYALVNGLVLPLSPSSFLASASWGRLVGRSFGNQEHDHPDSEHDAGGDGSYIAAAEARDQKQRGADKKEDRSRRLKSFVGQNVNIVESYDAVSCLRNECSSSLIRSPPVWSDRLRRLRSKVCDWHSRNRPRKGLSVVGDEIGIRLVRDYEAPTRDFFLSLLSVFVSCWLVGPKVYSG